MKLSMMLALVVTLTAVSVLFIAPGAEARVYGQAGCTQDELELNVWIGTYCVSGLPEYVGYFYAYFVGTIGIFAVAMMMFGGMKWITSGGNAEKISQAKDNITSAIIGVVLALISYVFLQTINPMITSLSVPTIDNVTNVPLNAKFCEDLATGWEAQIGQEAGYSGSCGAPHGIINPDTGQATGNVCVTSTCAGAQGFNTRVCHELPSGDYDCVSGQEACTSTNENHCKDVDDELKTLNPSFGCAKFERSGFGDKCVYGKILSPAGVGPTSWFQRADCGEDDAEGVCWEQDGDQRKPKSCGSSKECTNDSRAVHGTKSICVKNVIDGYYVLYNGDENCD